MTHALLAQLQGKVAQDCVTVDQDIIKPRLTDWYGNFTGKAWGLARPKNVTEVATILRAATKLKVPIVPQGGNTGLAGGAIPDQSGDALLLNLERMNHIRSLDPNDNAAIVEAGCFLGQVRDEAKRHERDFPLNLSTAGSCQIGGTIATNAGGMNVLRYGMIRDLVFGLEVVLANGDTLSDLRPLRKNNSGYDWKQIFIGSEGTLGLITAACLKLSPLPQSPSTALLALRDIKTASTLLNHFQEKLSHDLDCFELLPQGQLEKFGIPSPFAQSVEWSILVETANSDGAALTAALEAAMNRHLIADAILAQNKAQADRLWAIRDTIAEWQRQAKYVLRNDIALPLSAWPEFIHRGTKMVLSCDPTHIVIPFGHLGDGNIHFNILANEAAPSLTRQLHDLVFDMGGTFSAEHGIGQARIEDLFRYKSPEEINVMRRLKNLFDPAGILNPGKILPCADANFPPSSSL